MNPGNRDRWALAGAWLASLFSATIGTAVGVGAGALSLALKPVETVKQLPKEPDRVQGQVYFEPGLKDSNRAKTWSQKKRIVLQGLASEITLNEHELNAWLSFTPNRKDKEPLETVTFEGFNYRVYDSKAQVAATVQFNGFSSPVRLILQATGGFEKRDDKWLYVPEELWIGSLPVHRFPFAMKEFLEWQRKGADFPEQVLKAREHIADASVVDRDIHLRIQ